MNLYLSHADSAREEEIVEKVSWTKKNIFGMPFVPVIETSAGDTFMDFKYFSPIKRLRNAYKNYIQKVVGDRDMF